MNPLPAGEAPTPSYRALFAIRSVSRILVSMQIARIAQSMVSVTIVLFALSTYRSSTVAGVASFFSIFPGLVVSPIAGALLDRHGRVRLVALDYLIALGSLGLIGGLAYSGELPAWGLTLIAGVASLTAPLSSSGLRSLFPVIVPSPLWERVNAIDSTGYVMATIVGPPLAAGLFAVWGGPTTFLVIGAAYGVAALIISRMPDPATARESSALLIVDAWNGLRYTWGNRTLRGLGFSISVMNLLFGALTIIVPVVVVQRLGLSETVVGVVFAVQGLTGVVSAVLVGRMDTRNRERMMLAASMVGSAVVAALLLLSSNLPMLVVVMALTGLLNGPLDIALFTLRQRRTDPNWMGRAFAVSMAFNVSGVPIGAALAGVIAARSVDLAVVFGVTTTLLAGLLAIATIPATE